MHDGSFTKALHEVAEFKNAKDLENASASKIELDDGSGETDDSGGEGRDFSQNKRRGPSGGTAAERF